MTNLLGSVAYIIKIYLWIFKITPFMNTQGHCYPKSVTLQAVYFKLRFILSYRDVEEIIKMRGVQVDNSTIQRWTYKFASLY
ncbi:hypothetical protein [Flavobacterium sp.]|uniref:hypothetical protein n=1 Tax=Flavobacterium sp. TaxID=239 RepID=UPI003263D8FA